MSHQIKLNTAHHQTQFTLLLCSNYNQNPWFQKGEVQGMSQPYISPLQHLLARLLETNIAMLRFIVLQAARAYEDVNQSCHSSA